MNGKYAAKTIATCVVSISVCGVIGYVSYNMHSMSPLWWLLALGAMISVIW